MSLRSTKTMPLLDEGSETGIQNAEIERSR